MNPIFEFLDGKQWTLDGISGTLKHEVWQGHYPYSRTVERLYHIPDEQGKQTKEYQEAKEYMGDDWDTDLTDSVELYCEIAKSLGYKEKLK